MAKEQHTFIVKLKNSVVFTRIYIYIAEVQAIIVDGKKTRCLTELGYLKVGKLTDKKTRSFNWAYDGHKQCLLHI